MLKLLHLAQGELRFPFTGSFREHLENFGELTIVTRAKELAEQERLSLIQNCDVLLTAWGSAPVPEAIAQSPGQLRYICHVTGTLRDIVPLKVIQSGIPVTNWGDAPAGLVAEGAMVLLLAVMKDLQVVSQTVRDGGWGVDDREVVGGTLHGLNVGIYGMGVIGRRFVDLIQPFGSVLRVFDPFVSKLPSGCIGVSSLEELFRWSEAIVIHAGLTPETRHSVNAHLLSLLPYHGIIINTARGGIIDQDALFAELEKGRLRAGLDVLDGADRLDSDDKARTWNNLILTQHQVDRSRFPGGEHRLITLAEETCIDNLSRFVTGQPLRFVMDESRYQRST